MSYGMLAAKSCLLTDVVDQLHENAKKVNAVERLSKHLLKGTPEIAGILSYAREGIRLGFKTSRPKWRQLCFNF